MTPQECAIEEVDNGFIIRLGNSVAVFDNWKKAREYLDGFFGDTSTDPKLDASVWNSGYPHR